MMHLMSPPIRPLPVSLVFETNTVYFLPCPNVYWINENFLHSCYIVSIFIRVYTVQELVRWGTAQYIFKVFVQ